MTSDAQRAANRRNAQHSTGPKTPEGKAASSLNALRHGLCSKQLILFDEKEEDFDGFLGDLIADYAPADLPEAILVERIAVTHWRLRRVWRAEAAAFTDDAKDEIRQRARDKMESAVAERLEQNPPDGKPLTPDDVRTLAADVVDAAPQELIDEGMAEKLAKATLASVNVWPQRLLDLSRYEAALERQLHRLILDLDRVQQRRRQRTAEAVLMEQARQEAEDAMLARRRDAEAEAAKRSQSIAGHPMEPIIRRTNPNYADLPPSDAAPPDNQTARRSNDQMTVRPSTSLRSAQDEDRCTTVLILSGARKARVVEGRTVYCAYDGATG